MSQEFEEFNKFLMEEMKKAYSEKALDHAMHPRNIGALEDASGYGKMVEPDGDAMQVWLKVKEGIITGIGFWTQGCTTLVAAGSALTELARGSSLEEAGELTPEKVLAALAGLPPKTEHCAGIAVGALREAIKDCYFNEFMKKAPWNKGNLGHLRLEL